MTGTRQQCTAFTRQVFAAGTGHSRFSLCPWHAISQEDRDSLIVFLTTHGMLPFWSGAAAECF